jgi:hypothetical protein
MDVKKTAPDDTLEANFSKAEICASTPRFVKEAGTQQNIKSRHAQMIVIGGAIGTGVFLDLLTYLAEVETDAEMWTRLEQAEKEVSQNVAWRVVSTIWQ